MKSLLCAIVLAITIAPAEGSEAVRELFRRGDALAKEKRYADALLAWKGAYLEKLPAQRDLRFRFPVIADVLPRRELKARLVSEIDRQYPEEKLAAEAIAAACLGFFQPGLDLRSLYLEMLTQEIAGFYDPDTKMLYLVLPEEKPKRWFSKIVGDSSFDPDEQKVVLAHEMSHALVDQHFDLQSLTESTDDDDDVALAIAGLVEGEATLSMMVDMQGGKRDLMQMDPAFMEGYLNSILPLAATFGGGAAFGKAPLILRESLLFPYTRGLVFCMGLARGGKWDGVNRAFDSPPRSTEQVLHPEKYAGESRDEPIAMGFPVDAPLDGSWAVVKENCLGEFQIEVLLRPSAPGGGSARAAAGWDGDTYRVWRNAGAERCLAWVSEWDGPSEATEFAAAIRVHFEKALSGARGFAAKVEGTRVALVVGAPEGLADRLVDWTWRATASEKRVKIRKVESRVRFSEGGLEQDF